MPLEGTAQNAQRQRGHHMTFRAIRIDDDRQEAVIALLLIGWRDVKLSLR